MSVQLKTNKEKTTIAFVKDVSGNVTHDPDAINSIFRDFYKNYTHHTLTILDNNIDQFLRNISLPNLHHEQVMALDSPLSMGKALQHMPSNKTP